MIIAIDFDGTCVTHDFPNVGKEIGAAPVLRALVKKGHKLILWTMRSDVRDPKPDDPNIVPVGGTFLSDALGWFQENEIELWGIQTNPTQASWTSSPKAYAELYIDDAALGCPLKVSELSHRPYVDWIAVEQLLRAKNIL